jgi:hypothetical protein
MLELRSQHVLAVLLLWAQVLLLMEMLNAEPWRYYPLTLQFLSSRVSAERGRCPPPPSHMRVLVAPMEVRAWRRFAAGRARRLVVMTTLACNGSGCPSLGCWQHALKGSRVEKHRKK